MDFVFMRWKVRLFIFSFPIKIFQIKFFSLLISVFLFCYEVNIIDNFLYYLKYYRTFQYLNASLMYQSWSMNCYFCCTFQEHFLIPDHKVTDINGASFAGFYYICFQKSTSTIEGYYYHRNSEW